MVPLGINFGVLWKSLMVSKMLAGKAFELPGGRRGGRFWEEGSLDNCRFASELLVLWIYGLIFHDLGMSPWRASCSPDASRQSILTSWERAPGTNTSCTGIASLKKYSNHFRFSCLASSPATQNPKRLVWKNILIKQCSNWRLGLYINIYIYMCVYIYIYIYIYFYFLFF